MNPKIALIASVAANRAIGKDNRLLWHIPEDLRYFRRLTSGHVLVMGRETFESIGRPLPHRTNIVVTANPAYQAPGCMVSHSLEEALTIARGIEPEIIFIIGGSRLFAETIHRADKLYLTLVEGDYEADTFFPDYSEFTKVVREEAGQSGPYRYRFLELERPD